MTDVKIDFTNFDRKMDSVMEDFADILDSEMTFRCPKDYGDMANSIAVKKNRAFSAKKGGEIEVGTNGIDYASYVEWGTGPMINAHGSHNTQNPVKTWQALRERNAEGIGQTMPFARTAHFFTKRDRFRILKAMFK